MATVTAAVLGRSAAGPDEIELVQRGRDLGGAMWVVAAAVLGAWLVAFGVSALRVRPARVRAGPDAVDLPGDERPAVVNLITGDWSLER
jgi:hypothetical protein